MTGRSPFLDCHKELASSKAKHFKLHIDQNVQPVAITNRRTPFHLRKKIKDELDKLLKEDIIEAVNGEPTPWVSPIVMPPKKDGSIRLCVDMRDPNKAIQREHHCMPTTDELIQDLNGAVIQRCQLSRISPHISLSDADMVISHAKKKKKIFACQRFMMYEGYPYVPAKSRQKF